MSKKIFFSLALLFCICKMNAQIIAEHTYPGGINFYHLDVSGVKYFIDSSDNNTFNFRFYNLDHSMFKHISFPNPYAATYGNVVRFLITENLFDLDGDIEFAVQYSNNLPTQRRFVIYNENGSVLFNKNNAQLSFYGTAPFVNGPGNGILPTPEGTKMILTITTTYDAKVYSLPGNIACWECSDGSYTGNRQTNSEDFPEGINSQIFPNPSSSQTEIAYELPDGCRQATLKVFSIEGTLIKTFTITSDFDSIVLSNEDLAAGTYFYRIETPKGESDAKKFVIVQQ